MLGASYVPFTMSTTGGLSAETMEFLAELARRWQFAGDPALEVARDVLVRGLSVTLQRLNGKLLNDVNRMGKAAGSRGEEAVQPPGSAAHAASGGGMGM